jgi:hypothetical protein
MVAMITIMSADDLLQQARPFIASFVRFTEEGPTASILKSSLKGTLSGSYFLTTETREIAEEGLKVMQNKIGTTAYIENFNAVRQDVLGKRHERKLKRSAEFVTNPEGAARKKIRQHEKACALFKHANE